MIDDLKKEREKYLQRQEKQEEEKIFNAIHQQAYWNRQEEENKRMMANIDKELAKDSKKVAKRKELKQQLFEDTVCFVLMVIALIPTIMLLVVLCY